MQQIETTQITRLWNIK